ncbi:MAG TPA: GAF domain-containing protein [Vulgatibacter sp.]|nr:GAF domain-containing protein [Vulgatibacter sp.]
MCSERTRRSLPHPGEESLARLARVCAATFQADGALVIARWGGAADPVTVGLHGLAPPRDEVLASALSISRPGIVEDADDGPACEVRTLAQKLGVSALVASPIVCPDGHRMGVLAVCSSRPRSWGGDAFSLLADLGESVIINCGLLGEILERNRREDELGLLQALSETIFESSSLSASFHAALRMICAFTGWEYGEAWFPDENGKRLELVASWHAKEDQFTKSSRVLTFERGVGLPGRVWGGEQLIWEQRLPDDGSYVRFRAASEVGISAAVGIPVLSRGTTVAVLVFHASALGEEDQRLVRLITTVASQLGGVIQAKKVEDVRHAHRRRLRAMFDSAYEFIGLLSAGGRVLEANRSALKFAGVTKEQVVGRFFWDTPWWRGASIRRLREGVKEAASGIFVRFWAEHRTIAGNMAPIDFSLSPVFEEKGGVSMIVAEGRYMNDRSFSPSSPKP